MKGWVYKRCTSCGRAVPKRSCVNPDCGGAEYRWAFVVDVGRHADGRRRQVLRGGFETKRAAEDALEALVTQRRSGFDPPRKLTVREFLLDRWLPRTRTSPKTRADRETHMRVYVIPRIGERRLLELTGDDLTEMYDDLAVRGRTRKRHPELGLVCV
jgi:hypothetical protein